VNRGVQISKVIEDLEKGKTFEAVYYRRIYGLLGKEYKKITVLIYKRKDGFYYIKDKNTDKKDPVRIKCNDAKLMSLYIEEKLMHFKEVEDVRNKS